MLWIKAFHVISMVCWFAGLFYLPRLFVYHAECSDEISDARFKVMERRLYRGIMTPSAIFTLLFGVWLLSYDMPYYMRAAWMHAKLGLVALLIVYHILCGVYLKRFAKGKNQHGSIFYRWFNEVPVLFLVGIVIFVVVKP